MNRKIIAGLLLIIVGVVLFFLFFPSDESRIKKLIGEGSIAIDKEDIDAVMSKVSYNYRDDYGLTYLYIRESMKTVFQRMENIKVEHENLKIVVQDKTAEADMDVRIIATIGDETGYIFGDMPKPVHLRFTLEKERTTWLVTKTDGLPFDQ
ncbi:MAG: hypothetical protein MIO92_10910 [Methanosarcinaceae archaeon]|nr:hypothetical protein [Methanosarcinaceae archaeon]